MKLLMTLAAAGMLVLGGATAQAKDDLVIGVAQFPSSLHPAIDPEVVKGYILGFALRPITAFDEDWKNGCMLCTELPSLQNSLAKLEEQPNGAKGMAVTLKLRPGLEWGDGAPVTTKDLAFTWQIGKDPDSGFATATRGTTPPTSKSSTTTPRSCISTRSRVGYDRGPISCPSTSRRPSTRRPTAPGAYVKQTTYNRAPTTPGLCNGPYRITEYNPAADRPGSRTRTGPAQSPASSTSSSS